METTPAKLVSSTATAAFAADQDGCIVAWNAMAEALLGHGRDQAIGTRCDRLLGGVDVFGNRFCGAHCPVRRMARRREPVHEFEMTVRTASDRATCVVLSSLVLPGPTREAFHVVHLLRPVGEGQGHKASSRAEALGVDAVPEPPASESHLTPRELEVLGLLRQGIATEEIAHVLCVSVKTIRNHVQNSLRKLGAHSRLEALSVARRRGLL